MDGVRHDPPPLHNSTPDPAHPPSYRWELGACLGPPPASPAPTQPWAWGRGSGRAGPRIWRASVAGMEGASLLRAGGGPSGERARRGRSWEGRRVRAGARSGSRRELGARRAAGIGSPLGCGAATPGARRESRWKPSGRRQGAAAREAGSVSVRPASVRTWRPRSG
jgi:hypothetical protein